MTLCLRDTGTCIVTFLCFFALKNIMMTCDKRNVWYTGITGLWTHQLDAGLWTLDCGRWSVDAGHWFLDAGRWSLNAGL